MIDSGVCPWCQTIQGFNCYGRQVCQLCRKPIRVTPDLTSLTEAERTVLACKVATLIEVEQFISEGVELGLQQFAEALKKDIEALRHEQE